MKRLATLGLLCGTLLLSACTGSHDTPDGPDPRTSPSATPSTSGGASPTGDPAPAALTLTAGGPAEHTCFADPTLTLTWFDVTWKANTDLDSFSFELVNPHGVHTVGAGHTVPPVNFGGRIDYGGAVRNPWRPALNDRVLMVSQMGPVDTWTPIEGETGLLVLHLRFDPHALAREGATFDGVKATYHTSNGQVGDVTVPIKATYQTCQR